VDSTRKVFAPKSTQMRKFFSDFLSFFHSISDMDPLYLQPFARTFAESFILSQQFKSAPADHFYFAKDVIPKCYQARNTLNDVLRYSKQAITHWITTQLTNPFAPEPFTTIATQVVGEITNAHPSSAHYPFSVSIAKELHLNQSVQAICALACNVNRTAVEIFILNNFDTIFDAHFTHIPPGLVKRYNDAVSNISSNNPDALQQYLTGPIFWQEYTAYVQALGSAHYPVLEEVQFVAEISGQNITIHTSQDLGSSMTFTPTPNGNGLRNMTSTAVFDVRQHEGVFPTTSFEVRHTGAAHFEQMISDYRHS
jgi:hypothetical protein